MAQLWTADDMNTAAETVGEGSASGKRQIFSKYGEYVCSVEELLRAIPRNQNLAKPYLSSAKGYFGDVK
jgi:hypothetical protein